MDDHAGAGPSSSQISDTSDTDLSTSSTSTILANSQYLTRSELIRRRSRHASRLLNFYRDHFWYLMEDIRKKHREYVWRFGDDFLKDENTLANPVNNNEESDKIDDEVISSEKLGLGFGDGGSFNMCCFPNCPIKAMALTKYCFQHIMSDKKQVLYTSCQYALKSGEDPILCGKPVLKSTIPSLCSSHVRMAEMLIRRALKKGGLSGSSSAKLAPKFHLVLSEYVRLIQSKRRAAANRRVDNVARLDSPT